MVLVVGTFHIIVTGGAAGEALYAGPGDNPIQQFLFPAMVVGVGTRARDMFSSIS